MHISLPTYPCYIVAQQLHPVATIQQALLTLDNSIDLCHTHIYDTCFESNSRACPLFWLHRAAQFQPICLEGVAVGDRNKAPGG